MNNEQQMDLTIEQQFTHFSFERQVKQMSREQSQELLVILHKSMMLKDNCYKQILKSQYLGISGTDT